MNNFILNLKPNEQFFYQTFLPNFAYNKSKHLILVKYYGHRKQNYTTQKAE